MRYLSLFSGIEAATVAWHVLGWHAVAYAEIEPFPCAVLRHHYPDTPNLGNVTLITEETLKGLGEIDGIVFGSPCQDLSVAGLRAGLSGERSGLFHDAIRIIRAARQHCGLKWALWENVPGAFSSNGGRDFAAVAGALAGARFDVPVKGWKTTGVVLGDDALVEWRVLDAQWFGVAQRRRRVFAFANFGDWSSAPPVLLEPEGMRRDSAPSRETRPALAALTSTGVGTCGADNNQGQAGHLIPQAFGGNNTSGPIDVSTALNACDTASGRLDFETETFITQCVTGDKTHALTSEGFDASEDGTGRENPIIAFPQRMSGTQCASAEDVCCSLGAKNPTAIAFDTTQITSPQNHSNPKPGDPCHTLSKGAHAPAIAFSSKDHGADATEELSPTLRASGHTDSHANAGAPPAVAFQERNVLTPNMSVRRLTPRECERLQGFPDDYTLIPYGRRIRSEKLDADFIKYQLRGNPKHLTRDDIGRLAADGPRYKALGNSMAVPVMRWIGERIQAILA